MERTIVSKAPRRGVRQKYLNYISDVKREIEDNPTRPDFSTLRRRHRVGSQLTTIMKELGFYVKRQNGFYYWTGDVPSLQMSDMVRENLHESNRKFKAKAFALKEVESNQFKIWTNKPEKKTKLRRWNTILSFTIFRLKFKLYKLK